jgi:polar amino acid transport system substrate-binding protein
MNRRATNVIGLAFLLAVSAGACASQSSDASETARQALQAPTTASTTTPTAAPKPCTHTDPTQSLPAATELPPSGQMPPGSMMYDIQQQGHLVAGVDENTPNLAARDTRTGTLAGLEIELVKNIAGAITGNREAVVFKTVVTKEKNQVVHDGVVDLTASADSMTCERWELVDFSTEYLTAQQELLVRSDSGINGKGDLPGRAVCVTQGSSSVKLLDEIAPTARHVEVPARNDCLVALQQGDADAYLGHDTFIRGMHAQDPENTRIVDENLQVQHYGIALPQGHPEMVMFVNGVLEQMCKDGRLADLYRTWLDDAAPPIPAALCVT